LAVLVLRNATGNCGGDMGWRLEIRGAAVIASDGRKWAGCSLRFYEMRLFVRVFWFFGSIFGTSTRGSIFDTREMF
jgi:hypothetical protein